MIANFGVGCIIWVSSQTADTNLEETEMNEIKMTTQEAYDTLRGDTTVSPVLMEWVAAGGLPCAERDARIERHYGVDYICLDDIGTGGFCRAVSDTAAGKLVQYGLLRDARGDGARWKDLPAAGGLS